MNEDRAATATRQIDESHVRVTHYLFQPGQETGWHTHEHDYVIVPVTDGQLLLETPDGQVSACLKQGVSYNRPAGVSHNVINAGQGPLAFVEIELLR
jgi:quercetin dioxygenase-like cupin family protein